MGFLASISKENAGKGTVDEADNKIDDVKETTDGLKIKKTIRKKSVVKN